MLDIMLDIMLDLETMGTAPGSAITQIGAVGFDPTSGTLGPAFYARISLKSCVGRGLTMDPDTVLWWMGQSDAARAEFAKPAVDIGDGLDMFSAWLNDGNPHEKVRVWGNGAAFDNALLTDAYRRIHGEVPWRFWNDRCYRTLKSEFKSIPMPDERTLADYQAMGLHLTPGFTMDFEPTAHNALWDAVRQADHCIQILRSLHAGQALRAAQEVMQN